MSQNQNELPGIPPAPPAPVDSAGVPFDPAIHNRDSTGTPQKRRDGTWVPKGGRKPGTVKPPPTIEPEGVFDPIAETLPPPVEPPAAPAAAAEPSPGPDPSAGQPPRDPQATAKSRGVAVIVAQFTERVCVGLLGPDLTHTNDERDEVTSAWLTWIESKGGADLPPGWAIAASYAGIVFSRWDRPTVQQRIKSWFKRS